MHVRQACGNRAPQSVSVATVAALLWLTLSTVKSTHNVAPLLLLHLIAVAAGAARAPGVCQPPHSAAQPSAGGLQRTAVRGGHQQWRHSACGAWGQACSAGLAAAGGACTAADAGELPSPWYYRLLLV
jgi:hypothetical protein